MAKLLIPGVDPDADAIFRKAHGLGPDDPAPVSLESYTVPDDHARKLEMQRETVKARAKVIPSPGLSQRDLDRKLDSSVERANLRKRDFFSIPAADNRIELLMKSWPGARNDTKKYIKGSAPFGNFLFGAEAAAAGLSEGEARAWGQAAQIAQDVAKGRWPSWRDNADDPEEIEKGYRYFHERPRR